MLRSPISLSQLLSGRYYCAIKKLFNQCNHGHLHAIDVNVNIIC